LNTLHYELVAQHEQSGKWDPNEHRLSRSLAELAIHLNEPSLQQALVLATAINDSLYRRRALAALILNLTALPLSKLYSLWRILLHTLAARTRRDLLSDLCVLSPVLLKLGGTDEVAASTRAIQEVFRQWP
jgi:hypothetical protein